MPRSRVRVTQYDRVCPECHKGPIIAIDNFWYCPDEDAHPGGVVIRPDGQAVRLDRHLKRKA